MAFKGPFNLNHSVIVRWLADSWAQLYRYLKMRAQILWCLEKKRSLGAEFLRTDELCSQFSGEFFKVFLRRSSPGMECLLWTANFLLSWATGFFHASICRVHRDMICFSVKQKCCKDTGDCTASVGAVWTPSIGRDEIGEIAKGETSVPSFSLHNQRGFLLLYEAVIDCCILSSGSCHQLYLLLLTKRATHSRDRPSQGERERAGVPKCQKSA